MPTENRSSNTEMVSELLPCPFCGQQDFLIERLDSDASVVICQGLTGPHDACLARGPVGVAQDEGEEQPGRDKAVELWNARAEQHQGEPVALPEPYGYLRELDGQCQLSVGAARPSDRAGGYATPWAAIYAGKQVEQLRYKADLYDEVWELVTGLGFMNVTTAISKLRNQLAERDSLLTRALPYLSNTPDLVQHGAEDLAEEIRSASAGRPCYGPNEWGTECGKCSKCKHASAEPSEPVVREERAEFEREHERIWPFPTTSGPATQADHQKCKAIRLEGWQARAALESKPS